MTCNAEWASKNGLYDAFENRTLNKKSEIVDVLDRLVDISSDTTDPDNLYTIRVRIQTAFAIMQAVESDPQEVVRTLEQYIDDNINKHILT